LAAVVGEVLVRPAPTPVARSSRRGVPTAEQGPNAGRASLRWAARRMRFRVWRRFAPRRCHAHPARERPPRPRAHVRLRRATPSDARAPTQPQTSARLRRANAIRRASAHRGRKRPSDYDALPHPARERRRSRKLTPDYDALTPSGERAPTAAASFRPITMRDERLCEQWLSGVSLRCAPGDRGPSAVTFHPISWSNRRLVAPRAASCPHPQKGVATRLPREAA